MDELYANRRLAQRHLDLERLAFEKYMGMKYISILDEQEKEHSGNGTSVQQMLAWLDRLVDLSELRDVLVLGCGLQPLTVEP